MTQPPSPEATEAAKALIEKWLRSWRGLDADALLKTTLVESYICDFATLLDSFAAGRGRTKGTVEVCVYCGETESGAEWDGDNSTTSGQHWSKCPQPKCPLRTSALSGEEK